MYDRFLTKIFQDLKMIEEHIYSQLELCFCSHTDPRGRVLPLIRLCYAMTERHEIRLMIIETVEI